MALPFYLAMTRGEFTACSSLPAPMAWMACHFSPYGTGLTNLPPALPRDTMVILNDRIPMAGHDPEYILRQLKALNCACLLLDFQLPGNAKTQALAAEILAQAGCPVGVSEAYAKALDCPVFLSPVPPDTLLAEHLSPWQGREVWLEAALDSLTWRVTPQGAEAMPLGHVPESGQQDQDLCCHYQVSVDENRADFHIWRTRQDLDRLLEQATELGVTKAVGLWQELGKT